MAGASVHGVWSQERIVLALAVLLAAPPLRAEAPTPFPSFEAKRVKPPA